MKKTLLLFAVVNTACSTAPCDAQRFLTREKGHLAAGELQRVLTETDEWQSRCPHLPSVGRLRYDARVRIGDHRGAVSESTHLIELDAKNADAWLWRAMAEEQVGTLNEAAADYEKAIELRPPNLVALDRLVELDLRRKTPCHVVSILRTLEGSRLSSGDAAIVRGHNQHMANAMGPRNGCME